MSQIFSRFNVASHFQPIERGILTGVAPGAFWSSNKKLSKRETKMRKPPIDGILLRKSGIHRNFSAELRNPPQNCYELSGALLFFYPHTRLYSEEISNKNSSWTWPLLTDHMYFLNELKLKRLYFPRYEVLRSKGHVWNYQINVEGNSARRGSRMRNNQLSCDFWICFRANLATSYMYFLSYRLICWKT